MVPAVDQNLPPDHSSSLVLGEQSKALAPAGDEKDARNAALDTEVQETTGKTITELLGLVRDARNQGVTFLESFVHPGWDRSYKAYRNEHFRSSKYTSVRFQSRSKLFKPKTRAAVRKNQASSAGSLFGTADVVTITAQDESDPRQQASAQLKKELVNYRLDRANRQTSIPWFQVAMGAHQDAQITGICVSKQYWKYRERVVSWTNETDELTGETTRVPGDTKVVIDRPDIINVHPENIIIDPNCEWTDPAQSSSYLQVLYPMSIGDILDKMRPSALSEADWLQISQAELESYAGGPPSHVTSTRQAREGGNDPAQQANGHGIYRILWVQENFVRIDGEDYNFWTLGDERLLSMPRATEEAYPHLFGERPYVIGVGALEAHRPLPMSPVESWQQLQQEANEIVNLRLDQMKHVVNPLAKVARGRQVDLQALQRRGPDGVILLNDPEKDVIWDRPPDVPASAYAEANYLNNDFDELSGTFSTSSVATNRSLNETVGGMKMLSSAATTVTEFDLKVWIETWVDRVLSQIVKLEEFYESDERILVIAGQRAELVEQFGINEITDQLLMQDVTVKVSAGLGSGDPMQGLAKLGQVFQILGQIAAPFMAAGAPVPMPKWDELADEALGKAGYKNGFERFFVDPAAMQQGGEPGQEGASPEAQAMAMQANADSEKTKVDAKLKADDQKLKLAIEAAKIADKGDDRKHKEKLAMIQRDTTLRVAHAREQNAQKQQQQQLLHDAQMARKQRVFDASKQTRDQTAQRASDELKAKAQAAKTPTASA
jgi:hypothetical protein